MAYLDLMILSVLLIIVFHEVGHAGSGNLVMNFSPC